ncbi:hypothetical protein SUGI_0370850 [Cryptomeria japonica]|nr:hypothetical protein SUGI_0370850 [Cryptomeria japonica]
MPIDTPEDVVVLRKGHVIDRQSMMTIDEYLAKMWDGMPKPIFCCRISGASGRAESCNQGNPNQEFLQKQDKKYVGRVACGASVKTMEGIGVVDYNSCCRPHRNTDILFSF